MKIRAVILLTLCVACTTSTPESRNEDNNSAGSSSSGAAASAAAASNASNASASAGNGSGAGSSSNGGSGGASSSGVPGAPIPLDQLCPVFARGYARAFAATETAWTQDCRPVFQSEEQALAFLLGTVDDPASWCQPADGLMFPLVQQIADEEAQGRVRYDAAAAGRCVALGRTRTGFVDGTFQGIEDDFPGFDRTGDCNNVVVGLQETGEACANARQCASGSVGADCVGNTGPGCEGTCQPRAGAAATCGGASPGCQEGLECVIDDGAVSGTCQVRPGENEACLSDGAECQTGLRCVAGICRAPLPIGGTCSSQSDCQEGLWCTPEDVCAAGQAVGEPCDPRQVSCAACLKCVRINDEEPGGICRAFVGVGESCANALCHLGLFCSAGTCVEPAEGGSVCVQGATEVEYQVSEASISVTVRAMRGNCRNPNDICAGAPPVCGPRHSVNSTCESPPGPVGEQGSCQSDLFCARASENATTGTCRPEPVEGEACGTGPDLAARCASTEGFVTTSISCRTPPGICLSYDDHGLNEPCVSDTDCALNLDCSGTDAGFGTCQPGVGLGEQCGAPEFPRCGSGRCVYLGADGGYEDRCLSYLELGDPCPMYRDFCGPNAECVGGEGGAPGQCVALRQENEACDYDSQCQSGLICSNGACRAQACEDNTLEGCLGPNVGFLIFWGAVFAMERRRRRNPG